MTAPTLVYEDDLVQLWHGKYRDLLDTLTTAGADAVITDPPYGETSLEWDRWQEGWVQDALKVAPQLWSFGSFRMFQDHAADFAGWTFAQDLVWEKHNGSGFHADRFRRVHEIATHWYQGTWGDLYHVPPTTADATARTVRRKTRPAHTGNIEAQAYTSVDGGPRLMRSVMKVRSEHGRAIHPTQKPLGVVTPLIEYSVPRGGLVVDFFAGSATTALAARQAGRRAIVVERDKQHVDRAARRLAQMDFDLGGLS